MKAEAVARIATRSATLTIIAVIANSSFCEQSRLELFVGSIARCSQQLQNAHRTAKHAIQSALQNCKRCRVSVFFIEEEIRLKIVKREIGRISGLAGFKFQDTLHVQIIQQYIAQPIQRLTTLVARLSSLPHSSPVF